MSNLSKMKNVYYVSPERGNFFTVQDALEWLTNNMQTETTLYISAGSHLISDTVTINLPHALKIIGAGYQTCFFDATTGLTNKPMFIIKSNCDFHSITFDATTLTDYGNVTGENCINYDTDDLYCELQDIGIYGFNIGVYITSNTEIWAFNSAINNCVAKCLEINTTSSGTKYRSMALDYSGSPIGIDLVKATNLYLSCENDTTELTTGTDIFIKYDGTNITYTYLVIKGIIWNEVGIFRNGFDFTRVDGRDANIEIMYNVGTEDTKPHCKVNLENNSTVTPLTQNVWTKAVFTNTSSYTKKWTITDNRITYQSDHIRDVLIVITGNAYTANQTVTLNYGIVKNGNNATIYGKMVVTLDTNNRNFTIGNISYLPAVAKNDFFELWIMNSGNSNDAYISDLNLFAETI